MFITFEGPEGSGKTTQQALLVAKLCEMFGYTEVFSVREPGGTTFSEACRRVLLSGHEATGLSEALLVSASRAELVHQVIKPALAQGKIVVCDRYVDTTYAIQGYAMGVPLHHLREICGISTGGLMPDVTFLLDITTEEGYRRKRRQQAEQRSAGQEEEFNSMDDRALAIGSRYREGYREMVALDPGRWRVLTAAANEVFSADLIHTMIYERLCGHTVFQMRMLGALV